jgi:hypothetical protein
VGILSTEKYFCFKVFNEELRSYKGYCTWVVVDSLKGLFLVDVVRLRTHGHELKKVRFYVNQIF